MGLGWFFSVGLRNETQWFSLDICPGVSSVVRRSSLGEVDDVFSGFEHDLLAVVGRGTVSVGVVLVAAAVTQPAGPVRERLATDAAVVRLATIVLHAM